MSLPLDGTCEIRRGYAEDPVHWVQGAELELSSTRDHSVARFWSEPYSLDRALDLGIRDYEGAPVVGVPNDEWMGNPSFRGWPERIYYVEVCGFTFAFFSLEMIQQYLDFYSRKVLPSSRFFGASPFSHGAAASVGDGQSRFERLPIRLRQESKRVRVVKALARALEVFKADG